MRKLLITTFATLALAGLGTVPATAAPLDPCVRDATECRDQSGPGLSSHPDYFCTYQWRYGGEVCTHTPGQGQPHAYFVERAPFAWWNPLTW